jgi:hypothetical protein
MILRWKYNYFNEKENKITLICFNLKNWKRKKILLFHILNLTFTNISPIIFIYKKKIVLSFYLKYMCN